LEYSTQINIGEAILEKISCTLKHQYFWVYTLGETSEGKPLLSLLCYDKIRAPLRGIIAHLEKYNYKQTW